MGRGLNPGGGEIFHTCPQRPWGPPSLLYNGYQVFPEGTAARGVVLTMPPCMLRLKKEYSYTSTPHGPLWSLTGLHAENIR